MSDGDLTEQQQFLKEIETNLKTKQEELADYHGELEETKVYLKAQIKSMIELISQLVIELKKTKDSDSETVLELKTEIDKLTKCCEEAKIVKNDCCKELEELKVEMEVNRDFLSSIKIMIKDIRDFKVGTFDGTVDKLTSMQFCDDVNQVIKDFLTVDSDFLTYVNLPETDKSIKDIYETMHKTVIECGKKSNKVQSLVPTSTEPQLLLQAQKTESEPIQLVAPATEAQLTTNVNQPILDAAKPVGEAIYSMVENNPTPEQALIQGEASTQPREQPDTQPDTQPQEQPATQTGGMGKGAWGRNRLWRKSQKGCSVKGG